ncbi:MAG: ABC transporter permease [Caulobacterales bacterium]|nr:ABC transporter permease [Caulobacterales bacterium]
MSGAPVLALAARSRLNRRGTAMLTVLAVALAVMLFTGVEKIRDGARASFERTISGADLIVGARSGAVNLLLYAVFRIGDATNNITWESYETIAERPEVDWAVPLSLGDSHRGFRVVGTTPEFFERYRFGDDRALEFSDGDVFSDVFHAVVGAGVARELGYEIGDDIILAHGVGAVSFSEHTDKPFTIIGVLAPTGTPVDRSVHVSLQGIEAIHIGWERGAPTPLARIMTADRVRQLELQPKEVTAIIVGMKSKIAVLGLQRDINTYRQEALMAVIPGIALAQLWEVVGVAERALAGVSAFVIVVGLVGVLTSILTSLNERRREMAILRSVGARPADIFILLVSEAALLAFVGSLLGLAFLYGGLAIVAPLIEARYGLALTDAGLGLFDLWVVLGVTGAALLLGAVPAWRAFRNSLADGLTVRF